jgi:hypothetical protein
MKYMKSRAPQGRRLGDKRLEVVEAADVVLHVAGHFLVLSRLLLELLGRRLLLVLVQRLRVFTGGSEVSKSTSSELWFGVSVNPLVTFT